MARKFSDEKRINSLDTSLSFLDNPEKHNSSKEWVKQIIMVVDVLKLFGLKFKLIELVQPDRDNINLIFSRLIENHINLNRTYKEYEDQINKNRLEKQTIEKFTDEIEENKEQLDDLRKKKQEEKPLY